jgi:hypothetical protein
MSNLLHPVFADILAPLAPKPAVCPKCHGTGETASYGILDCSEPGCAAAVDRHALNTAVAALGPMTRDDLVWHVFQAGMARGKLESKTEKY